MRSAAYYYWYEDKVWTDLELGERVSHRDLFCVDTKCADPQLRYGKFIGRWQHIPFDQFPSEFRAHLLLLGVS